MLVATSKINTASGYGEVSEWQSVQIGKKDFLLNFFLTEIMNAADSCIAKNHFAIQLGIRFPAFVPLAICGSKVLRN